MRGWFTGMLGISVAWTLMAADARPEFEAASLKKAWPGDALIVQGGPGSQSPTLFRYQPANLVTLMYRAYGLPPSQISGPEWIYKDQFAVTARVPPKASQAQFNLMLQRFLEERFHIALHKERRKITGFELRLAKGGPKLRPFADDPNAPPPSEAIPNGKFDKARFSVLPPGSAGLIYSGDPSTIRAAFHTKMTHFVTQLGGMVMLATGDPMLRVVDKTGLQGKFDFTLAFSRYVKEGTTVEPSPAPDIFTALKEQLGLTLAQTKIDAEFIVIDKINRTPEED